MHGTHCLTMGSLSQGTRIWCCEDPLGQATQLPSGEEDTRWCLQREVAPVSCILVYTYICLYVYVHIYVYVSVGVHMCAYVYGSQSTLDVVPQQCHPSLHF